MAKSQNTLPDIAQQLLKQSKTEATKGQLTDHTIVMQRVKAKYNL